MTDKIATILQNITPMDIAAKLGFTLKRKGHEYWGCCPIHSEKTPSFQFKIGGKNNKWIYSCHGCGAYGDVINLWAEVNYGDATNPENIKKAITDLSKGLTSIEAKAVSAKPKEHIQTSNSSKEYAKKIWQEAKPLSSIDDPNNPAWLYLKNRSIDLFDKRHLLHPSLRYKPKLTLAGDYPANEANLRGESPAIIIGSQIEKQITAIQRIYITQDGYKNKSPNGACKFTLGDLHTGFAPVWLGQNEDGNPLGEPKYKESLVIAEGLENALAFATYEPTMRIVCGLGLGRLQRIQIPKCFTDIILCADRPKQAKHKELTDNAIHNWNNGTQSARVFYAPNGCDDFNDYIISLGG